MTKGKLALVFICFFILTVASGCVSTKKLGVKTDSDTKTVANAKPKEVRIYGNGFCYSKYRDGGVYTVDTVAKLCFFSP